MNKLIIRKKLALLVCAIAMATATTSSSLCVWWLFDEIKMPKSLYKLD